MGNGNGSCATASALNENNEVAVLMPKKTDISTLIDLKKSFSQDEDCKQLRFRRYIGYLTLTSTQMQQFYDAFLHELELGLVMHEKHPFTWKPEMCSFKMLDSCVGTLPNGQEEGVYYAIDFGGTNLRAVRCSLKNGTASLDQYKTVLSEANANHPKGLMDEKATASELFDFLANSQKQFMSEHGDMSSAGSIPTGFTFSFPCVQRRLNVAELVQWTKGFESGRKTNDKVEGQDVATLLDAAYTRNKVPAYTAAVANDTVGTLLSAAYSMDHSKHPPCLAGLIIGTGFNICYVDPLAPYHGYQGQIINVESGNFNRQLPRINVDFEVDFGCHDSRGFQLLEKMVAGAYLGEVTRITLLKIFQQDAPPRSWQKGSLSAEDVATAMNDKTANFVLTKKMIQMKWGVEMNDDDIKIVNEVSKAVYNRSAQLCAALCAATAKKTGKLQAAEGGCSIAIDGSLYKMNPWFRERMRFYIHDFLGKELGPLIHLLVSDDGSGKGAAILAAISSKH